MRAPLADIKRSVYRGTDRAPILNAAKHSERQCGTFRRGRALRSQLAVRARFEPTHLVGCYSRPLWRKSVNSDRRRPSSLSILLEYAGDNLVRDAFETREIDSTLLHCCYFSSVRVPGQTRTHPPPSVSCEIRQRFPRCLVLLYRAGRVRLARFLHKRPASRIRLPKTRSFARRLQPEPSPGSFRWRFGSIHDGEIQEEIDGLGLPGP